MRSEGSKIARPTTRRAARLELRVWLDSALYERILLESAARGGSASKAVREAMREYFALKDELIPVISRGPAAQSSFTPDELQSYSPLQHPIVRMVEEHAIQARKLDSVLQGLSALACMIEQAYQGLVGRLNPVPQELRAQRAAAAEESAQRLRTAVSKLLRRKYGLLDDLSKGED
ncbi:MAG TPA: hypothetical protein VK714_10055 [Myxococcota bacterium]|nr:hypothetical protein [Myxococcota bacterium]